MKAISSMATRHLLADLVSAAVAAGLPHVEVESVGGVDAAQRVAAGEDFALAFLASGALATLADNGHLKPETVAPLVLSQVAAAVGSGSDELATCPPGAAFADAAGMRAALLAAPKTGYSTGPSGTALLTMIESWGLTDELDGRLVQARPGVPVAKSLSDGTVDLGFQQLSELVGQPGVRILGVLPADCAIDTVFAGAVTTASSDQAGAAEVLAFFTSDAVAGIKREHSFALPTG